MELLHRNDMVMLPLAQPLFRNACIGYVVLDHYMPLREGPINALGRNLMVKDKDKTRAGRVLKEARSK